MVDAFVGFAIGTLFGIFVISLSVVSGDIRREEEELRGYEEDDWR